MAISNTENRSDVKADSSLTFEQVLDGMASSVEEMIKIIENLAVMTLEQREDYDSGFTPDPIPGSHHDPPQP